MKKLLILISLLFSVILFMSVNSRTSDSFHEYATVNVDPGASGYYTNPISIRAIKGNRQAEHVYFSIRGTGSMTITLQFKCSGDTDWTNYDTYSTVKRAIIEGGEAGTVWRAGVVNSAAYISGEMIFGFGW